MLTAIIAATFFSIYFIEIGQLHRRFKIDFKPFSCVPCLSAWMGLLFYFLPAIVSCVAMVMFVPGVLSSVFVYLLNKLYGHKR